MMDRILIVEDSLDNMIGGLTAFNKNSDVEDVIAVASLTEAIDSISTFKPTVALIDMNIRGGRGTEVGKLLTIPHVYVTQTTGTTITILSKDLAVVEKFEGHQSKVSKIWQRAFDIAKGL